MAVPGGPPWLDVPEQFDLAENAQATDFHALLTGVPLAQGLTPGPGPVDLDTALEVVVGLASTPSVAPIRAFLMNLRERSAIEPAREKVEAWLAEVSRRGGEASQERADPTSWPLNKLLTRIPVARPALARALGLDVDLDASGQVHAVVHLAPTQVCAATPIIRTYETFIEEALSEPVCRAVLLAAFCAHPGVDVSLEASNTIYVETERALLAIGRGRASSPKALDTVAFPDLVLSTSAKRPPEAVKKARSELAEFLAWVEHRSTASARTR